MKGLLLGLVVTKYASSTPQNTHPLRKRVRVYKIHNIIIILLWKLYSATNPVSLFTRIPAACGPMVFIRCDTIEILCLDHSPLKKHRSIMILSSFHLTYPAL